MCLEGSDGRVDDRLEWYKVGGQLGHCWQNVDEMMGVRATEGCRG